MTASIRETAFMLIVRVIQYLFTKIGMYTSIRILLIHSIYTKWIVYKCLIRLRKVYHDGKLLKWSLADGDSE